jgi:hypothetical protein
MTSADLHSLASAVYGSRWQSQLARDMGLALRTVQRWAANGIDKPATVEGVRRFLEERRIARIPSPPPGTSPNDDRDDACCDALRPAVEAMVAAAADVGWHQAESLTAILAYTAQEMRERAGRPATIETLEQAIAAIKNPAQPGRLSGA